MVTNKLAWIDVETSGLFPEKGARVVEIGVVVTDNLEKTYNVLDKFHTLIRLAPEDRIKAEPKALQINGYNDDTGEWKNAPYSTASIWKEVARITQNCTLIAQNYPFDEGFILSEFEKLNANEHGTRKFIENELAEFNLRPRWTRRFIDIMSFSWLITRYRNIDSFSLENAYNALGLTTLAAHRSLADIERCIAVVKHVDEYYPNRKIAEAA